MIVINYVGQTRKLSKVVLENYKDLSYSNFQKLLRKRDIKVDGKRVNEDISLYGGEKIEVYAPDSMISGRIKETLLSVVYEDKNLLVVDKPSGIEVVSNGNNDALEDFVWKKLGILQAKAVHRIDRNTRGLVIFSKNSLAEQELLKAIKNHEIKKIYHALVVGDVEKREETLIAYLKTDKQKAMSYISISPKPGYVKIITKYKVKEEYGDSTLLEIELVTGKTHQIRAHFAYIGHPLVGDGKYGKNTENRRFHEKKQMLISKKLEFNFKPSSMLYYLNGKIIESKQSLV